MKQRIVCAACRYVPYLFIAPRHFDSIMHSQIGMAGMSGEIKMHKGLVEQGFIDNKGKFLDRIEAYIVATKAGQIIEKTGDKDSVELFTEDIY